MGGSRIALMVLLLAALPGGGAWAAEAEKGNWSLEVGATPPIVRIYLAQAAYAVRDGREILFGACFQNWKSDRGQAHAYSLVLGYRHSVWRGLHGEVSLFPAYNPFRSAVDGRTYRGVELWGEVRIGYRFEVRVGGVDFLIIPQPGIGRGLYRHNPWPGNEEDGKLQFIPMVYVGLAF